VIVLSAGAIAAVLHDAFEVILLPRRIKSKRRIVRYFFETTWFLWSKIGGRLKSESGRHNFLGLYGPLSLISLLILWAVCLIAAYGSIFWALTPGPLLATEYLNRLYFSGVTFFTLGYGDMLPHGDWPKVLSVVEAGTGLGFIALVIGYLPVIYQLFSRREVQVITLDSIAGSPPTAITILSRYADGQSLDTFDAFLLRWQHWSAELLESQLSYPMLAYYRSQHDNQSWLAALTAIMDVCVLVMVGLEGVRTLQARLTFATARLAAVEMGRVLSVGPQPPDPSRLSSSTFLELKEKLAAATILFIDEDQAEERLASFRSTYEPFLCSLGDFLMLDMPPWVPDPQQLDNWVNSPRGKSARRLLESATATSPSSPPPPVPQKD
jgi:hypothetical protein